ILGNINSMNCKDLNKKSYFFYFVRSRKQNMFFMQKTHSVEAVNFWKLQWSDCSYVSNGTSHSAGVMVLLNTFPGKVIIHFGDIDGLWLVLITELDGDIFILVYIYVSGLFIIGGDFNLILDLWLDRTPPRAQFDCWRVKNPVTRQYTWFNASGNGQSSRLDYWELEISSDLLHEVLNISAECLLDAVADFH
uniref:Endonuclease/exonuclease/phosphatase domain-containing protein n=1 Tax=Oryzias melastigma TaxID=30732 RepID=A0A3B3BVB9_ORYME